MADGTTLYAPDGRPYTSSVPAELVRLRGAGYSDKPREQLHLEASGEQPAAVFDPADHNVDEVQAFLREHPELTDSVVAAEKAGKNRAGIVGS